MRAGLTTPWSDEAGSGARPFNARAETLTERRMFAGALACRRCVVPVDGFFEWLHGQPYLITAAGGEPLAIAGIWDPSAEPDSVASCAVVITPANGEVARLHDRMPAILPSSAWDAWLDVSNHDTDEWGELLRPAPTPGLSARPVDRRSTTSPTTVPTCSPALPT